MTAPGKSGLLAGLRSPTRCAALGEQHGRAEITLKLRGGETAAGEGAPASQGVAARGAGTRGGDARADAQRGDGAGSAGRGAAGAPLHAAGTAPCSRFRGCSSSVPGTMRLSARAGIAQCHGAAEQRLTSAGSTASAARLTVTFYAGLRAFCLRFLKADCQPFGTQQSAAGTI